MTWKVAKLYFKIGRIKTPPVPDPIEKKLLSKYRVRYTVYERHQITYHVWNVCYDDCGKEIKRTDWGIQYTKDEKQVVVNAWEVEKYIGDKNEYNKKDVNPITIEL